MTANGKTLALYEKAVGLVRIPVKSGAGSRWYFVPKQHIVAVEANDGLTENQMAVVHLSGGEKIFVSLPTAALIIDSLLKSPVDAETLAVDAV